MALVHIISGKTKSAYFIIGSMLNYSKEKSSERDVHTLTSKLEAETDTKPSKLLPC